MTQSRVRIIEPPPAARWIERTLENAGFETWCVGGGPRDALLGYTHLDWDLTTAATPAQVRKLFRRTVPVGVDYGTVGVLDRAGVLHEVTTFRRDVQTDGRHAVVEFGVSLEEDLARRDFTINAIAYSSTRGIRDPFSGQQDLQNRIVRAVGDPALRMREDRLRALRALRFAARFDFTIDDATWKAICESAPLLNRLSAERVKQEIEKTMDQVLCPSRAFRLWRECGALRTLIPPLADIADDDLLLPDCLSQPGLPGRPGRQIARLTALFASVSPGELKPLLAGLRFSRAHAAWISAIAESWRKLRPDMMRVLVSANEPQDETLRRWAAVAGRTRLPSVLRLAAAEAAAIRGRDAPAGAQAERAPAPERVRALYRRAVHVAYRDPIEIADLAVDGNDLAKLGISGPEVGIMLRALLESVIKDPACNTREELLGLANRLRRSGTVGGDPPNR